MTSVIEELYLGNLNPSAVIFAQDSPIEKAIHQKSQCLSELMEKMDESIRELFNKYCDAQADVDEMVQYETFAYALKVGVLFMAEVFMGAEEILGRKGAGSDEIHTS